MVYKHTVTTARRPRDSARVALSQAWQVKDAVYLNARGVSYAIVTTGRWDEVASFVEFMGYPQPWYSVRDTGEPVGGEMGCFTSYLRDGDRVFLTYSTTDRGTESPNASFALLDMTPYGRGEAWEDKPDGWPQGDHACLVLAVEPGRESRLGPYQPPGTAVDPPRRDPRADAWPARPPPLTRLRRRRRPKVVGAGRNLRTMRTAPRALDRWAVRPGRRRTPGRRAAV